MFLFSRLAALSFVLALAACAGDGETGYPGVTVSVIVEKPYVEKQGEAHTGQIEITALRDINLTDIELGSSKLSNKDISKKEWVTLSSDNLDQMLLKRGESIVVNFRADVGDVKRPYSITMKVDGTPYRRYFDLSKSHHDDMTKGISVMRLDQEQASNTSVTLSLSEDEAEKIIKLPDELLVSAMGTSKSVRITAQFGYLYPKYLPVDGRAGWDDSEWDPDPADAQEKTADTIKYTIYDSDVGLDDVLRTGYTDSNGAIDETIYWTDCLTCDVPDIYIEFQTKNSSVVVESASANNPSSHSIRHVGEREITIYLSPHQRNYFHEVNDDAAVSFLLGFHTS